MKRTGVFLLSFLLLGAVAVSGTGSSAFAWHGSPRSPGAAVLICSVSGTTLTVTAISTTVQTTATDCAAALVALESAGLVIKDVQVLNTTPTSVVFTLVNGP